MAEIVLRTRTLINAKQKYTAVKPRGGVAAAVTDQKIQNKWIETICDLMSPAKRDNYSTLPYYDLMTAAWTEKLRQDWIDWQRSKIPVITNVFWDTVIKPLGLVSQFGNAPESTKPLYETWLWSEHERKQFFIIHSPDEAAIKAATAHEDITYKDDLYKCQKIFDYEKDITFSKETVAKINDPTQVVNPRFDKPVSLDKFAAPILIGLPETLTNYRKANCMDYEAFKLFRQREESSPTMNPAAGGYDAVCCDNGVYFGVEYKILDPGLFV